MLCKNREQNSQSCFSIKVQHKFRYVSHAYTALSYDIRKLTILYETSKARRTVHLIF